MRLLLSFDRVAPRCQVLSCRPSPSPSLKSKPQIPKSQNQRGKEEFGLWAVSKILWANHSTTYHPITFRGSECCSTPECQEGVPSPKKKSKVHKPNSKSNSWACPCRIVSLVLISIWAAGTGVNVCGECVGWWEEFK